MNKLAFFLAMAVGLLMADASMASTGGGLPWEAPLETIKKSLTGPVALTISIIGMGVCGFQLIWGAEITGFVHKLLMTVLAISVLIASGSIITKLFGVSGAIL